MRVWMKAAALAIGLAGAVNPAHAIDPFFPAFGNNGIDVRNYDLDLDVAIPSSQLTATATLQVAALSTLRSFQLDLAGLNVSQVFINNGTAAFSQANDKLTITPRGPLPKGSVFVVTVRYSGVPKPIQDPTAPGEPSLLLGWFNYQGATYALSEPVGASTFYPSNDEPTDKATFKRISVTVPAGYTGVANGVLKSTTRMGAKTRFVWSMTDPMTTWLATVHVNRFDVKVLSTTRGKPLRFYSTAATPPADVEAYARSRQMIAYLEGLVGPYPFAGYGSVVVDDPALYYALETQGMSTFPLGAADDAIIMHEAAHQWFGNSISVARWEDLWLGEGFATYFEVLWPNRNDPQAFNAAMFDLYDYAVAVRLGPARVERGDQIFSDRTYVRGALTLFALRQKVGDATFFRILTAFEQRFKGGNASSEDFIATALSVSGDRSVVPLLSDWIFRQPVPPLQGAPADAAAAKRSGPPAKPDLVGLRCGRGGHRGAPAGCGTASGN